MATRPVFIPSLDTKDFFNPNYAIKKTKPIKSTILARKDIVFEESPNGCIKN
jgi:hypothetical protein